MLASHIALIFTKDSIPLSRPVLHRKHIQINFSGDRMLRYGITCFGCRAIANVINAAAMHKAPAAKNAGK